MLKPSKDSLGYTKEEILAICRERKIHHAKFWKAFGVNTVSVAKDGTLRYYLCDVEKVLFLLKESDGKYHEWD